MERGPNRLRSLSVGVRAGLTSLVVVLLGGLAASGSQVILHHANRDGTPGLSWDDLVGAYHGVHVEAPMLRALRGGHPGDLDPRERDLLVRWLTGSRVSEEYDGLDLGDAAPAEVLDRACLSCHARRATGPEAKADLPMEYWDDVRAVAFGRSIEPMDRSILVASTHAHALAMGTLTVVTGGLLLVTGWPRRLVHASIGVMGVTLLADLGGQWLGRIHEGFVLLVAVGGPAYLAVTAAALLAILVDPWRRA